MNSTALIMMVGSIVTVICFTLFYLIKVLRIKPKDPKNDSYKETN